MSALKSDVYDDDDDDRAMLEARWAAAHREVAMREEAEWHKQSLDRWYGPYCRKLEPDELEECHRLIDEFVTGRMSAAEQHREHLATTAQRLARKVKAYELTLEDAERRLDALASQLDPDFPCARYLLPWAEAREIVRAAFAEVLR